MLRTVFVCVLSTYSFMSLAASWTNGGQSVKDIIWTPDQHGFYVEDGQFHDPERCRWSSKESLYLFSSSFEETQPQTADRLFSMILESQTTGKTLAVLVDGCVGQHPKIVGLKLSQ
ncbi:hypothetical protein [Vibrio nigripulchritudo]|uniref:hypothetical protein n=1 Tax=Vibrio nigripulchritudo TaxID=28173 RepID=UPI0003B19E5C|nr:hypothetical protein [Vibrio nigripulchritudo]CCN97772.1 conserved exported hypothetical protein [Vibrio nigripulchritudo ENn2]